jgi:hypothetical protein
VTEEEHRVAPLPPAATEPQDALDWELDNAIGAIIASGRGAEGEAPPMPAPVTAPKSAELSRAESSRAELSRADAEPVPPGAAEQPVRSPAAEPAARPAAEARVLAALPAPRAAPAADQAARSDARPTEPQAPRTAAAAPRRDALAIAPVGGARRKPIPTFRFERRDEPDDPLPAVPRDVDDPLANVFFDDVRQAFDAVHPAAVGDDPHEGLSELETDSYDPPLDDDDELPPSLVRAAAPVRQRRRSWRSSGVAAAVLGIAGVAVAAVIGMNVFAGPGSSDGEPPVIRADARDVKVEPEAGTATEEVRPDISERAALGESDRLVLPDQVTIADAAVPDEEPLEEELVSRRVRTVVVRPDGTIVPAEPAEAESAAAVDEPAALPEPVAPLLPDAGEAAGLGGEVDAAEPSADGFDESVGVPIEVARADPAADPAAALGTPGIATDAPPSATTAPAVPRARPPVPPAARSNAAAARSASADTPPLALAPSAAPSRAAAPVTPWDAPAEPAPASSGTSAPWAVQLASQRSRADAEASLRNLRQRYPNLVGSAEPIIVAANVDGRGTFYRVRLPAASRGEAAALCQRLKSAGADCFIGRN